MDFNLGFLCSWENYWLIKLKAFVQESDTCLVLCTKTDAICTRIVLVITHAVIPIRWDSLTASRQPFRWFTWNTNLLIWSWSCNAMTYSLDIPQSWIRTENIYRQVIPGITASPSTYVFQCYNNMSTQLCRLQLSVYKAWITTVLCILYM